MHSVPHHQYLLQIAKPFHVTTYREAFGRCFAATLGIADSARRHGIKVELVRWQVVGDRDFCDHWVVACDDGTVIDPTRVQVDGRTDLLQPIAGYPRQFRNLRRYPAELLLPLYAQLADAQEPHIPLRFMWRIGIALVRHDMRRARQAGEWRQWMRGMAELARVAWRTTLGALQHQWIRPPQNRMGSNAG